MKQSYPFVKLDLLDRMCKITIMAGKNIRRNLGIPSSNPNYQARYHKFRRDNDPEFRERTRKNGAKTSKKRRDAARIRALLAYGGQCACCGLADLRFLTFDHINNDGAEHRKKVSSAWLAFWLAKENWPTVVQILCYNCNCAKQYIGGGVNCPHQLTQ